MTQSTSTNPRPKRRRVSVGEAFHDVTRDAAMQIRQPVEPTRTIVTDNSHVTIMRDKHGRKIGFDRTTEHWSRLSLRARAILEGSRRS